MGWFIVATYDGDEEIYRQPVRAVSPANAVAKRGVDTTEYQRVYVYPVLSTPTGGCQVVKVKDD